MPELPEVQCVVNSIKDKLKGQKIKDVVRFTKTLREPLLKELDNLKNSTIKGVERKGKYIIIKLDKGCPFYLVVHLGMTGALLFRTKDSSKEKHDHLLLELDDFNLVYNDVRKFGFVTPEKSLDDNKYLKKLGIEPLENNFENGEYLYKKSRDRNRDVKVFLLDQSVVAGIGNIYIMEALFLAGIHPQKKVKDLSFQECESLSRILVDLLRKSIEMGGSSISDYKDADNKKGSFQDSFLVYGKKQCSVCSNKIERIKQNSRATYFCPNCQRK